MSINPTILKTLHKNGGMITTEKTLSLGFSKTLLGKYEKAGLLNRVSHGLYMLPDEIEDDMYTLMLRSKHLIFSHESALFLCGLSNRTPFIHSVTIPSNAALRQSIKDQCKYYYIKPSLHPMGLIEKKTTMGHSVRCYNPERTVCDFLRSRSRCDEETVINAIKAFAASKNKDLNLLSEYASKLHVTVALRKYMEVLL